MNDESLHPDDELLSAYLDGELAAEERAQVEARLAADPAARALLEELRSLSATVRSLPRTSAPQDMLAGLWTEIERSPSGASTPPVERSGSVAAEHGQGLRRGLAWGAFAVAATLLLALFLPQADREAGEVAVKDKRPAAELPGPASSSRELDVAADKIEKDASLARSEGADVKAEAKPAAAPEAESSTLAGSPLGAAAPPPAKAAAEAKLEELAAESAADGAAKGTTTAELAKEHLHAIGEPAASAGSASGALADEVAASERYSLDSPLAPAEQTVAIQFNAPAAAQRLEEVLAANNIRLAADDSEPEAPPELLAQDRKQSQASRARSIQQLDDRQQTAVLIEGSSEAVSNVIATLDNDRANFSNFRAASPGQQQLASAGEATAPASSADAGQDQGGSKSFGGGYGGAGRFGQGGRENEESSLAGKKIAAGQAWFFVLPVTAVKQWAQQQSAGAAPEGLVAPPRAADRRAEEQRRDFKAQTPSGEPRMRALILVDPPAPKS